MLYHSEKNIIIFILLIFRYFNVFSQGSDIIIHSNPDLKFKVYFNNKLTEKNPDTLIYIKDVESKDVKLIIKFEKKNCNKIKQILFLKSGSIYNYKIIPKNTSENKIDLSMKNKYILKQISCYPKNSNNNSELANTQNESIIITTTYSSDQYVTHYNLPGYNGDIGCPWPLTLKEFDKKYKIISKDSTDIYKLKTAIELFTSSCLFTDEVNSVSLLISDEKIRLDFVKFAIKYTFDIGNYSNLQDVFHSELIKNDFNNFLKNRTLK